MLDSDQPGSCGTQNSTKATVRTASAVHGTQQNCACARSRDYAHHCVAAVRAAAGSPSPQEPRLLVVLRVRKGGPTVNGGSSEFVSGDAFESYRSRRVRAPQAGDVDKNVGEASGSPWRSVTRDRRASGERPRRTLIALVYHESRERTDTRHVRQNLHFFLREGVTPALSTRRFPSARPLAAEADDIDTPGMTVHQLNGSSGFELWHYRGSLHRLVRARDVAAARAARRLARQLAVPAWRRW